MAVIASISRQRGIELYRMFYYSITVPKFLVFLEDLRSQRWADDVAIFVDQLSVHRSRIVKERCEEMSIPIVFNSAYSPNFMPIENIFAQVKSNFRMSRLHNIAYNKPDNVKKQI